jgi:hypothetical protein
MGPVRTKILVSTALSSSSEGRPDGLMLTPIMPYPDLAGLTDPDSQAIAASLKSLPPLKNEVPGPFGPKDKATTFVSVVISAEQFNKLAPAK